MAAFKRHVESVLRKDKACPESSSRSSSSNGLLRGDGGGSIQTSLKISARLVSSRKAKKTHVRIHALAHSRGHAFTRPRTHACMHLRVCVPLKRLHYLSYGL
jgi:hypothetical protein